MKICRNGVLPNLKLKAALASAHASKAIYHSKGDVEDVCLKAGGRIRMMAAKYREIAIIDESFSRCMCKAGGLHIAHEEINSAT